MKFVAILVVAFVAASVASEVDPYPFRAYFEQLASARRSGSANFEQVDLSLEDDGYRSPQAIYFEEVHGTPDFSVGNDGLAKQEGWKQGSLCNKIPGTCYNRETFSCGAVDEENAVLRKCPGSTNMVCCPSKFEILGNSLKQELKSAAAADAAVEGVSAVGESLAKVGKKQSSAGAVGEALGEVGHQTGAMAREALSEAASRSKKTEEEENEDDGWKKHIKKFTDKMYKKYRKAKKRRQIIMNSFSSYEKNTKSLQDAHDLCNAMKGWGTDEATLSRIMFDRKRDRHYLLLLVKPKFEKKTRCKGSSLQSWIKGDTSCTFRDKLLAKLQDPKYNRKIKELENLEWSKAAKKQGRKDAEKAMPKGKPPRTVMYAVKKCGKHFGKGVLTAIKGWASLGKAALKALINPIEAVSNLACAAWKFTKKAGKAVVKALKWSGNVFVKYLKNTAKACVGRDARGWQCVKQITKGAITVAFPFHVAAAYTIKYALSVIHYGMKKVFGALMTDAGREVIGAILCEIAGVIAFEFIMLPFAIKGFFTAAARYPMLLASIGRKLGVAAKTVRSAFRAAIAGKTFKLAKATGNIKMAKAAETAHLAVAGAHVAKARSHHSTLDKVHHAVHKTEETLTPAMAAKATYKTVDSNVNADEDYY